MPRTISLVTLNPALVRAAALSGKLQRLPGSLLEAYYSPLTNWSALLASRPPLASAADSFAMAGRLYPVLKQEMIKRPAKNVADESIADFVTRRSLISTALPFLRVGEPSLFGGRGATTQ